MSDETLRLLALLDGDEPTAILDNVEEIADQMRRLAGEAEGCREVHRRLDAAGVSSARRVPCDDPTCQTQAGHRVKVLIGERDALLARAQQAEADAARLRAALTATMQRTTGYDWNADPDNITLLQSEALHV